MNFSLNMLDLAPKPMHRNVLSSQPQGGENSLQALLSSPGFRDLIAQSQGLAMPLKNIGGAMSGIRMGQPATAAMPNMPNPAMPQLQMGRPSDFAPQGSLNAHAGLPKYPGI